MSTRVNVHQVTRSPFLILLRRRVLCPCPSLLAQKQRILDVDGSAVGLPGHFSQSLRFPAITNPHHQKNRMRDPRPPPIALGRFGRLWALSDAPPKQSKECWDSSVPIGCQFPISFT